MQASPRDASGHWFAGALVIVRVHAAQSQGRLGVWESAESRDDRLPLHVHQREDEQVVLLDGQVTFWSGIMSTTSSRGRRSSCPGAFPTRTG